MPKVENKYPDTGRTEGPKHDKPKNKIAYHNIDDTKNSKN